MNCEIVGEAGGLRAFHPCPIEPWTFSAVLPTGLNRKVPPRYPLIASAFSGHPGPDFEQIEFGSSVFALYLKRRAGSGATPLTPRASPNRWERLEDAVASIGGCRTELPLKREKGAISPHTYLISEKKGKRVATIRK